MNIYIYICHAAFLKTRISPSLSFGQFSWNCFTSLGVEFASRATSPTPDRTQPLGQEAAPCPQCAAGQSSNVLSTFLQSILLHPWFCNQIALWYNFVPHSMRSNIFQNGLTAQHAKISNHTFHLFSLICKYSLKIIGSQKFNIKVRLKYGNNCK